jgi:hypothetical protein
VYYVIREGVHGTAMPGWKALPDDAIWDLVAYVLSVGGGVTIMSNIPRLSPGQLLFVPVLLDRATGENDYQAYRLKADAFGVAKRDHTTPVDWQTALAKARS